MVLLAWLATAVLSVHAVHQARRDADCVQLGDNITDENGGLGYSSVSTSKDGKIVAVGVPENRFTRVFLL